jgi:hypothetical protein
MKPQPAWALLLSSGLHQANAGFGLKAAQLPRGHEMARSATSPRPDAPFFKIG